MNNERLTKKVFLHDYDQNSNNSWSYNVENVFDTFNLLTHYENKPDVISPNWNPI